MRLRAILALFGAMAILGCGKADRSRPSLDDDPGAPIPDDPISDDPPAPLACDYCVHTAPATFTGPSNFYRGRYENAPDCRDPTPLQGIEGFLTEPTLLIQFVRECLITPTDTCAAEGAVCAPLPGADYQTCVHHTGEVDCPTEYAAHRETILVDGARPFVMTLCCMSPPISG